MKITSLEFRNYKRFVNPFSCSFHPDLTLLVGQNGKGKSSILQMIAANIGTATQDLKRPFDLNWAGFNYHLINSGRAPLVAKLNFEFNDEETIATQGLYDRLLSNGTIQRGNKPSNQSTVSLSLNYQENKVVADATEDSYLQFRGYAYAKMLSVYDTSRNLFNNIGKAYWYSEERNTLSFNKENGEALTEDKLRQFLISRYLFHERRKREGWELETDQRDIYEELKAYYRQIFPNRSFVGPAPRANATDAFQVDWFMLSDGTNQYEISEMSAGERAIFPILIDFANWKINNSIILIDELELHLHPPLQQAFLQALPNLGINNQFIISTHSDYIATLVDESQIIRL